MIERQYGRLIFVCDDCGNSYETDKSDFNEAWAEVRDDEGWSVTKDGDKWVHWCHAPCEPSA